MTSVPLPPCRGRVLIMSYHSLSLPRQLAVLKMACCTQCFLLSYFPKCQKGSPSHPALPCPTRKLEVPGSQLFFSCAVSFPAFMNAQTCIPVGLDRQDLRPLWPRVVAAIETGHQVLTVHLPYGSLPLAAPLAS